MNEFRTNHCKEVNSLMLVSFTDIGWQAQQGPPTLWLYYISAVSLELPKIAGTI